MPRRILACLLGLLPFAGGCTMYRQINENFHYETGLFFSVERHNHRLDKDAAEVLREVCNRHPHKVFSKHFREGFTDGYKDFLLYGGPARPPAMPPPKYRTARFLSPEGHCKVRDYFLGFQYGADCAESTGRRQYFTVPVLVTDQQPPPPLDIVTIPPPPDGLSTDGPNPKESAPAPKVEGTRPEVVPQAMPKTDPPKADPSKVETPKSEPKKVEQPKVDPPKADPPKVDVPKPEPAKPMTVPMPEPKRIPPVEVPKVDPPAKPPTTSIVPAPLPSIPVVPASYPAPVPVIPMLPSVSLVKPASNQVVPAGAIAPIPNTR